MKALVKAKPETGIWMQDVEKPPIGAHDVLIKIKKTAICGTDVHIYNWDKWASENVPVPLVTGHEYSGVIEEIGDEVTHLEPGMRVSGEGHIVCGHCRNCRGGQAHLCRDTIGVGVNRPGAFAEYLSLPASNVFPLSDSISDEIGALLDPLGNATHTALSFDLVGEDVIITGAGPIGILAAAIARHCGARNIVITDVNDYRLELAEDFGVTATLNATKESMAHVMQHLGMTEGFDIGLEMSGNGHAINDMIRAMRHGGEMALLGIMPDSPTLDYNKIVLKGLHLKGIYGREMFETWYKMKAMIESGLDISPIITHRFPIDDYEKGFEAMRSGESGKVILEWD